MNSRYILECRDLGKSFNDAGGCIDVFSHVDIQVAPGELIAILGRSGSGKSSLLHLFAGLDLPTAGTVLLNGVDYQKVNEKQRSIIRNKSLGFIYQFHHLLPEFTALENVCIPLLLSKAPVSFAKQQAAQLLKKVGLGERLQHKVAQLSGGERQRVAICRALINQPNCVLADEPTGNLDKQTAEAVFDCLLEMNRELGTCLMIVTHDEYLAKRMDRVLILEDGKLY